MYSNCFYLDIAIQILASETFFVTMSNVSILTINEYGRFLDLICNTGLLRPNVGKWILPNGIPISQSNEKFEIERGGGIVSLPYITLKMKEGYSLNTEEMGLYTCVMPDINEDERVSHIWVLPEQNFGKMQ